MKHSESLDKLAAALLAVQGELEPAAKSRQNPHLKNHYSTLGDLWDAARAPLQKHGIAVYQGSEMGDDGGICVVTMLLHSSGQFISSEFRLPLEKPTAQSAGSAITYGRRYGLAAAIGVLSDEDDDGHAASAQQQAARARQAPAPAPAPRPAVAAAAPSNGHGDWSRLPMGKGKGTPNRELSDDDLLSAYRWAEEKDKFREWRHEALQEITRRELDLG
jgi:hypothetical protein